MPRHPPNALNSLLRSHCLCSSIAVPKERQSGYLLQPDYLLMTSTCSIQSSLKARRCTSRSYHQDQLLEISSGDARSGNINPAFPSEEQKLQQQKCLGQAILPTSNPSTNSGRLSHHMVSQGLVSDVSGINPKHLDASRHIFSSQCIQNRHLPWQKMQTFISSKGYSTHRSIHPHRPVGRRPSLAGPSGAQRQKPRQRQDITSPIALAIGGAERDRTADPLLAKQVLSQLSYSPNHRKHPTA